MNNFLKSYGIPTLLFSSLLVTSSAQDLESTSAELVSSSSKSEKTLKAIAEAAALTEKNMAEAEKNPLFDRVRELHKQRATYLKDYADGKVRPFPNIVENWQQYGELVKTLSAQNEAYTITTDPEEKLKLAAPLLEAIQPLGKVLENADHGTYTMPKLTEKDFALQEKLMNQYNEAPSSDDEGKLKLITPEQFYTLKNLPIPIQFSAPEGTEVFLFSELGGHFPNNLSYIRITADENNLATTAWISIGDGVADCNVIYRSSEYPSKGRITPIVKELTLRPLEMISPVFKETVAQTESKATTPAITK